MSIAKELRRSVCAFYPILSEKQNRQDKPSFILRSLAFWLSAVVILFFATSASAFYYPPTSHVPPGAPPNYNQIDTTYFLGTPVLPIPPPDSGGVYIYYDQGIWTIANHIYSKGNSLEQFHGSILAQLEQPPQLGINVYITDFEMWGDTSANLCLQQNDRWGWVQWGDSLYEIWWDVTTKEYKPNKSAQDMTDFMSVHIIGTAIDFNIWSSGHQDPFGADQAYAGAAMTRLIDIPGYSDTFSGITDPYQSQAGSDPGGDPNVTIFTAKALPGEAYNQMGLIQASDSYPCDPSYGTRYTGAFAYEGNGIQFSTNGIEPDNQYPNVFPIDDSTMTLCVGDTVCFELIASDPDVGDTVTLELLEGPISYTTTTAASIITEAICFFADTTGLYRFVWRVTDRFGLTKVDTIDFDITRNCPPRLTVYGDTTIYLCDTTEVCITLYGEDDDGDDLILTKLVGPGTSAQYSDDDHDGDIDTTHCFLPDTSGTYCFVFELDDDGMNLGIAEDDDDIDSICITVIYDDPVACQICTPSQVLDLVLTDENNCPVGVLAGTECFLPTSPTVDFTIIGENTPWSDNNWLAWNESGQRNLNVVYNPSDASGATSSVVIVGNFGLNLLNDVDLGMGLTNGTYDAPDDAWLFSKHTLSLPDPPNAAYQWFVIYDVSGQGFQNYRWWDGNGQMNSFSGDYDLLIFVDDDHTAPNFDYDDFMMGISGAEPAVCLDCQLAITCPSDVLIECDGSLLPANTGAATATGICTPISVTYSDVITPGACANSYSIARTWLATDNSGNTATCNQTITVEDTMAPILTGCPADVTVQCDAIPAPATVTAADNCDPSVAVIFAESEVVGACPQEKTITRTWTATDECGNSSSCSQTIIVVDTTAPVLTGCPADVTVQCDAIPAPATVTAADNCDPSVAVTFAESEVVGACPQEKTITRTWTATDECGNSSSCSQTIIVVDTTAPVLTGCPADVTVECGAVPGPATVMAADNCDPSVAVTFAESEVVGACPQEKTITRTWTATDECGNSSSCSQTIIVVDTTAPVLTGCPADVTVECGAVPGPANVTVTDNCDPSVAVAFSESVVDLSQGTPPGACPTIQIITRTWTATDECGNVASCSQTINVNDTQPPVFDQACPDDITVQCDAIPTKATLTATDVCEGAVAVICTETITPGNCPSEQILTWTWVATDRCGNSVECIQVVTVVDTTAPVLVGCPDDVTVDCNAIPGVATVTATDNCDAGVDVTFSETEVAGSCPVTKIITRTWTAVDSCGNEASCSQIINVTDTIAPVLAGCPSDITVDCNAIPDPATVTATDICDGDLVVTLSESEVPGNCPTTRIITRTWTAADACGNTTSCSQTINVTDTIAPVLAGCPSDVTVECNAIPDPATVTATDECDGDLGVSFFESEVPGNCPTTRIITRTWTAVDACGNIDECLQTITVQDNIDPILSGCPSDVTVECNAIPDPATVTATDECDGALAVDFTESEVPGNCPTTRIITRTWSATDACGNVGSCSQTITVQDNIDPVLAGCPADVTVDCNAIPDPAIVTATDECDGDLSVDFTESEVAGNCPTLKVITRTWTATDACGNTASCSQTINVQDNDGPTLSGCPADVTVECNAIPAPATVTAFDACDGTVVVDFSELEVPGNCPTTKVITRSWTATDACGNVASCSQTITVQDNIDPVLAGCPTETNITVDCDAIPDPATVTAIDECDGNLSVDFTESEVAGTCPTLKVITRTWTATDACGNSASCSQTINVQDTQAPTITASSVDLFQCDPQQVCVTPTINDNCDDSPTLTLVSGSGSISGGRWCYLPTQTTSFSVTLKAEDDCGNSKNVTFTVDIEVNEAPVCQAPANLTTITLDDPSEVCLPVGCTDVNGNLLSGQPTIVSGPGTIIAGEWCYTPEGPDTVDVTIRCEDECGDFCETGFQVIIEITQACPEYEVHIEKTHGTLQGHIANVLLYIDSTIDYSGTSMGAFEFLIAYDASALTFMGANPGQFLDDCGWEYFTYRTGACGDCNDGSCPSGELKIVAIAETNDGANHPSCLTVNGVSSVLAEMSFLVSNDRTLNCSYVPIRFHWCECTDNTVSSPGGDTLYISLNVFDYRGDNGVDTWEEITDYGAGFPGFYGAGYECENLHDPGKVPPQRCLQFYNGGIDIVCSDSIDARGDINLDGLAYTISDAVMLVNYFVNGLQAFVDVQETNSYGYSPGYEGSIAASDVNADGLTLTVGDLVYLIRVIVGDANPYPKVQPIQVDVSLNDGILSVAHEMGAVALLVEGNVVPQLLSSQVSMKYKFDGQNTKVIVYSLDKESFSGGFIRVEGAILNLEMATYEGQPAKATLLPTEFSLGQNYPNPFNPTTQLNFTLGVAGDVTLSIYNVQGQLVATIAQGFHEAGQYTYQWEAGGNASGVYLYRLKSGGMEQTRKMILLK